MLFAAFRFEREEAVAVIGEERAHHAMIGHPSLDIDDSRSLGAAGAARDLMQKLEGALGRAQIAAFETEIGVDHANQGQQRKVMAFRHDLRADQHIDLMRFDGADRSLRPHADR